MAEETKKTTTQAQPETKERSTKIATSNDKDAAAAAAARAKARFGGHQSAGNGGRRHGGRRGRGPRRERPKPEFEQKIVSIRRVTRVMAGGRRFSFSVAMIIGDKKGAVGVGIGKANDTSLAIQKAYNNAKRNMIQLELDDKMSIKHEVEAKYNSARVVMMPNGNRGVVAGSSLRTIIDLSGMQNVTAKVRSRSKNQLNNARALIKALAPFAKPYKKPAVKAVEAAKDATPAKRAA